MLISITKLVTGEKNGKAWFMVHAINQKTGDVLSKFTNAETFAQLRQNTLPLEGLDEMDVEFDASGRIVGVR